ncbi:hypothetical protein SAMN05216258_11030 [Albimonas pacifica]|uniref:Bacteriophage head to tail connecting protein n=1 Tax=Albimonas pacifica TaxID=1114924 RepID=A0A1I3LHF2_9RHOB|nr:hypothetical protein SAMN05216258_11030 [Albimonas pacifica]
MEDAVTPAKAKPDAVKLEEAKRLFLESETATQHARDLAQRDRDYYDNWQLTDSEIATLRARGQPPVVINRIKRKVDWLRGLEAQKRTDPRAFPRTPQHERDAESATDSIKFVCDSDDFDGKASSVFENMLVEGFGGIEVSHRVARDAQGNERVDVALKRWPWDRLFFDPHSREPDFSDARYLGGVIWQDLDEVKAAYPQAAADLDGNLRGEVGDTYDDRPKWVTYVSSDRARVRVVLLWRKVKGVWSYTLFCGGAVLEEGDSPYMDEDGNSTCPLILQSTYVDRENRRYGIVREMIDVQDEINKRRSKALHLLTQRQTFGRKGVIDSVSALKREMARPDGHVEFLDGVYGQDFGMLNTTDLASGQLQLLQEAKNEIDGMQASGALSGDTGESTSGRAVLARQQGAMVELAPIFDRYQSWKKRVYRAIWNRIRQFWTEERWIRVTDDERNIRWVGINQPITLADALREMPEEEAIMQARALGLVPDDPRLGMVVGVKQEVAGLDVDIILDEVPDALTLQGETFEAIANLATSGMVPIPPEMIVELAPGLRRDRKDKLLELIQQRQEMEAQAQQQGAPLAEREAVAKIEKDESIALKNVADAQAKAREGVQAIPQFVPGGNVAAG